MPIVQALTVSALLVASVTACAARFQQSDVTAAHAVLALPSQEAQRERRIFIEPVEFNGKVQPRNWLLENFRIPPGKFRLLARAANEHYQGSCLLQFDAVAGQTYLVDAGRDGETFSILALVDGEVVSSCTAPAVTLPTPARIPDVPLR